MGGQFEVVDFAEQARRGMRVRPSLARIIGCCGLIAIGSVPVTAQQPGADGPSKALEGRWTLELYLETPSARFSPMAGQINGEIAFSNTAWWNPRDRFGRHSLDLQSFFGRSFLRPAGTVAFGPADTSMVTEVSGNVRGDSVNIDFIPRVDHGGISMWGRFYGDSAKGKWDRRGTDGDGRFVMRRVSKEAVSVAAIPDGRPVAVAVAAPPKPLTKAELRAKAKADALAKAKAADSMRAAARAEKLAKAKAADSVRAVARAEARAKSKADSIATAQARDSARTVAAAAARARKDSIAAAAATTKARRDSLAQVAKASKDSAARVAEARKDSAARVAQARKDSIAQVAKAKRDSVAAAGVAARSGTRATRTPATATAAPNATPAVASALTGGSSTGPTTATATVAAAGAPNGSGPAPLRVRAYDIATNTYFSTKYSLHLPDGHWLYGTLKTGSTGEGYGPAVIRPPGTYEIEVTDFMCGDKVWFLKNKILKKVVIAPGTPTDVTIDVNLATEPARPSLENKEGATCTSPPGAVR
jgi:hypothetical protein